MWRPGETLRGVIKTPSLFSQTFHTKSTEPSVRISYALADHCSHSTKHTLSSRHIKHRNLTQPTDGAIGFLQHFRCRLPICFPADLCYPTMRNFELSRMYLQPESSGIMEQLVEGQSYGCHKCHQLCNFCHFCLGNN